MTAFIVDRSNFVGSDDGIGGKATNLLRLQSFGLPVPEFFCIGSAAFRGFVAARRRHLEALADLLPSTSELELPELSRRLKDELAEVPVPEDLSEQLRARVDGGTFFSVRSSALQEDSGSHSFAGLFRTALYVPPADVPSHVRDCWLSAFEPGVLGYCRRNGLKPLDLEVGVVVQQMVRSRVSGVLFTADPAGALSEVVVVAGFGLGEGIVADLVETDTYRYDRVTKVVTTEIAYKQFRIEFDDGSGTGTRRVAVPAADAAKPALDPDVLERLITFGLRAESSFGDYQDVEWAVDHDGQVFVLQSRPITTIPPGSLTIFDNSNVVEGYPGISLPLTFSLLKNGYERNFSKLASVLGVPASVIAENRSVFRNMVGYIDGRIYYNLTNWYAIVNLNPALGRRFIPAFDDMIGVRKEGRSAQPPPGPLDGAMQLAVLACNIAFRYATLGLMMRRYRAAFGRFYDWWKQLQIESMTTHELLRTVSRVNHSVFAMIYMPLINDMLLMLQVAATKSLMQRLKLANPDDLLNGLMCGEAGMESVLPVHSLVKLAELLDRAGVPRGVPAALLMEQIDADPALAQVRAARDEHIRLYGDRCPEELKLETDTFREAPIALLETALRHRESGLRLADMQASEMKVRHAAESDLSKQLAGRPMRGLVLRWCIARMRTLLRNREAGRLDRARIIGVFRSLYRQLGRKLASERTLGSSDDIYHLSEDEVSEVVHGSSVLMDLRGLHAVVAQRKATIKAAIGRVPAERLLFRGTGLRNPVQQARAVSTAMDSTLLVGTPCSPGIVEAEAIVIDSPAAAPDVTRKIIVARMTDPGWVFLMITSAGLIVEKGSLLSHTAIIGRELGIPTIVGVQNAASRIQSGQRIRMDASTGQIVLLDSPAPRPEPMAGQL